MIEIPGYHILRQLGRGGMATVYLALQESVQREVALKVMSPALLADPDYGERFLREARIAARLHHRHVVGIHDVARVGDYYYIAMEYLGGGPIITRDGVPRPVAFGLRITREIALALNYAHAKGFVHRDVKPDNILLRDDTSSALTDFGIARAADSATRMTRTGAVIGTPHYMSPEQARGRQVDGRADLYSLGIVLYELLLGRVPYSAEDSLAVGIMHITEPVPVLPEHLSVLQPILSRLLAKQPEDRYQNGQQVADAIEQVETAIADGDLPELGASEPAYRYEVPNAAAPAFGARISEPRISDAHVTEISAPSLRIPTPATLRGREDPSLGSMEGVATTGSYRHVSGRDLRGKQAPPARPWGWIVLVLLIVLGAGVAWRFQDRLRALIPNGEANGLLARAQQAFDEGRLIGSSDSARDLFQSARSLDPDNDLAREGLNKVGMQLLDQAQAAFKRNDLATAQADLDAADQVLGGGDRVEQLKNALRTAETRGSQIEDLLARADAALANGQLLGGNSASALYKQVLDADAGNAIALNGLEKVAKAQAQTVREAIAQNDADSANRRIADLAQLVPNHPSIPELRAALAQMRQADTQAQDRNLARAEAALRDGKLGSADGALALYQDVLKHDAGNAQAKAGLRQVGLAFAAQATVQLDANNLPAAAAALKQAEALAGDSADVRTARSRLRDLHESADIADSQAIEPSLQDRARIEDMLAEADRALAAGSLMDAGGAWDKYKEVLTIDGNNTRAIAGLNRIPARARELFEQALGAGKPNSARGYLEAIGQTDPGNAGLTGLKDRLAGAYLDQAEMRIAQGQRNEALRAVNSAREVNPYNPRLSTIEQKIQSVPANGG